ncbi:hypothetical protein SAPIO_CDS4929 [Scedosporium apiospermum]|uniref:Uncharacterized protein n=1 Tax=Pseudallescheria apiosperma TaxID=563466 RepID=A0A084G7C7_PSEDA|nr:uncharacterized protein SAPIO_CDS4929 [Scedosporium apiospermum]KEZ43239.1 hypothetical protein SAPIO_CDS4929 [Scedosporium apiospermum]
MDTELKIDPRFADILKTSALAYEAEEHSSYEKALALHNDAINRLTALAKKGGFFSFLSRGKRLLKRQVETKIGLHRERIKALGLYGGKEGSKLVVPAVTSSSVARELGATDGTAEALLQAASVGDITDSTPLSLVEILHPQHDLLPLEAVMATVPPGAPTETWVVRRAGNTAAALEKGYFFTVKDATETNTLYILEAPIMYGAQVPFARLSRAGEYPRTAALIKLWRPAPMQPLGTRILHKGRPLEVQNDLLQGPVKENPDVRDLSPWGPRRFSYGSRNLVWKPKYPEKGREDGNFETLYEYNRTWARPDGNLQVLDVFDVGKAGSEKECKVDDSRVAVDTFRIQSIAELNGFRCPRVKPRDEEQCSQERFDHEKSTGIWLQASPDKPFTERRKRLKNGYGFEYDCDLCSAEANIHKATVEKRASYNKLSHLRIARMFAEACAYQKITPVAASFIERLVDMSRTPSRSPPPRVVAETLGRASAGAPRW